MEPWLEEHLRLRNEEATKQVAKYQTIEENLPSWSQVETVIDNATTLAALKIIVKKLARVVYWLAKNRGD